MISGLLRKAGVYMGEEVDFMQARKGENGEGFWEHFGFYALNEHLLLHLGAGWDMPDLPAGWAARSDLEPFREEALQLIQRMESSMNGNATWGWKDPRNSITVQFWESVLPGLRVVVCVRNPLEVAASLQQRNNLSFAASCRLWLEYYRNILDSVPGQNRLVILYERFLADPETEIKRLAARLGLKDGNDPGPAMRRLVNPLLHHQKASFDDLLASGCDAQVIEIYRRLVAEAEGNGKSSSGDAPHARIGTASPAACTPENLLRSRFHVETAQREEHIRLLTRENTELRQGLEDLKVHINKMGNNVSPAPVVSPAYAHNLSTMAERLITLHGLLSHKRSQFASMQGKVESTLKETKPMWPRFIRCSNSINSLFRLFKRIRKSGKLFTLQRELNDVTFEALGTLTHMAAVTSGHRGESYVSAPGLERYAIEKIRVDVPNLMELLRIRLS